MMFHHPLYATKSFWVRTTLALWGVVGFYVLGYGQFGIDSAFIRTPLQGATLDTTAWQQIASEVDYSFEKRPAEEKSSSDWSAPDWDEMKNLLTFLAIIFVLGIVALILYQLDKSKAFLRRRNTKIEGGSIDGYTIEEIEEKMETLDLQHFIQSAEANEQYHLAIRIYFLESLKRLSLAAWIAWKKDKTNRAYQLELEGTKHASPFNGISQVFNKAWYSNAPVTETMYASAKPLFVQFIESIEDKSTL